jgi:hypothetical protein
VLLVHHEQAEVLEGNVLLEQAVRPDHDVHGPAFHPPERLQLLGFRAEAREHVDADREGRKPPGERAMVLVGKERRGHKHRDLHVVLHGLERARGATSVLPILRTSRSMGRGRCISASTSSMAFSWSGVSS